MKAEANLTHVQAKLHTVSDQIESELLYGLQQEGLKLASFAEQADSLRAQILEEQACIAEYHKLIPQLEHENGQLRKKEVYFEQQLELIRANEAFLDEVRQTNDDLIKEKKE